MTEVGSLYFLGTNIFYNHRSYIQYFISEPSHDLACCNVYNAGRFGNKCVDQQVSGRDSVPVTTQSQSTQKKAAGGRVLMWYSVRLIRYAV